MTTVAASRSFFAEGSRPRTALKRVRRFAVKQPLGLFGLIVLVLLTVVALVAPWLATHPPNTITADLLAGPSSDHFFGTDHFGRDVFSRTVHGARVSLWVGAVSLAIGIGAGSALGLISGYVGGVLDATIQRIVDTLLAIPWLVLAMTIVAIAGNTTTNVMIAVGIIFIPGTARVVRGAVLVVKNEVYMDAARVIGGSTARMMLRHLLPNVTAPIIVLATIGLGNAIIAEASLSFLGLGSPPPAASWGRDLAESRSQWVAAQHTFWPPVVSVVVVVFSFNFVGDALRDMLDPRLRDR